jgi:GNAT superfamily N-acetyltransferase
MIRLAAGAAGFFTLIQSGERPTYGRLRRLATMLPSPSLQAWPKIMLHLSEFRNCRRSMAGLKARPLEVSEWELFRDFRLMALKDAPGAFATSFSDAARRTPEAWQSIVSGPTNQVFGLFDGEHLIGIAGAFATKDDPLGQTATLVMSYVLQNYRGRGLSRLLYAAALGWIRAHARFTRVTVAVRASNAVSQRACEHHGFAPLRRVPRTWPDGGTEDEITYQLRL